MNRTVRSKVWMATAIAALMALAGALATAGNAPADARKHTKPGLYLTAEEAHALAAREKALFLDIRTRAEVQFLGMPTLADANVPYIEMNEWWEWDEKKGEFKMEVNSHFAEHVARRLAEKGLDKNSKIILMCRSGHRSAKAADYLAGLGYTQVYSVIDGYEGDKAKDGPMKGQRAVNGWRNARLPWSYKLDRKKMYFN